MNTPRISFSFSFLLLLPKNLRLFIVGSIISMYGLILYELFPEFLFNLNYSISYFIIPMSAIAGIVIGLPIILGKLKKTAPRRRESDQNKSGDEILNELVTGVAGGSSGQQGTQQQIVQQDGSGVMSDNSEGISLEPSVIGGNNPELEAILAGDDIPTKEGSDTVGTDPTSLGQTNASANGMNEDRIRLMIDEKFEPVEKDLSGFKKDLNKIKEDMKITKENVDSLTESFEGTLTDMKAFQAEIANPLNFMRKYFESIDIKSLSDPSLPLRQTTSEITDNSYSTPVQRNENQAPQTDQNIQDSHITAQTGTTLGRNQGVSPNQMSHTGQTSSQDQHRHPNTPANKTSGEYLQNEPEMANPMDSVMKPLFSGTLSVSNLMSIVELAGEMLKENGDDCIELLVEQCKLMGLKDEDESTIFNIIEMLKKSGMNVEETIIQLYKFSKIIGINDKDADEHYAKLLANRKKKFKDKKPEELG